MKSFDPTGPLPDQGSTVLLEASAGTGKTHTIAAVTVRLIVEEGVAARDLLIVTFGRSATAELRERIRLRLRNTLDLLDGRPVARDADEVDKHLLQNATLRSQERLRAALSDFDAATISTVHQFCSRAMRQLGVLGDSSPGESHLESLDGLISTSSADTYLQMAGLAGFDLAASRIHQPARLAISDAQSRLDQQLLPEPDEDPGLTQEFARRSRQRAEWIRRRNGWVTYDDQILRLTRSLTTSPAAAQAAALLRQQYPVVLVDEFQDTDEAQWAVLETVFHTHSRLVLIGDPKQAIYAFRGGDVHTYARAAQSADETSTLLTNYRSDQGVVDGVNALFAGRLLGSDPEIVARNIGAHHTEGRLTTADKQPVPAFRGRILSLEGNIDPLRERIAADTAEQIASILLSDYRLADGTSARRVSPKDIAVLTRTRRQAAMVAAELRNRAIPCREHSADNVLQSEAARDWLSLLRALADPTWPDRGNEAALALLGGNSADLAADPDAFADQFGATLRDLREVAESGFPGLARTVLENPAAMAAIDDRRRLTDLRHIAELLATQHRATGMPVAALADWLAAEISAGRESHAQRLESEDPAVVVMTVHASKGLQFPIVFVPYAWDPTSRNSRREARFHHADHRLLDVRATGDGHKESLARANRESDDEEVRLLYVALTRAANQVVWHWAWSTRTTKRSALHRTLAAAAAETSEIESTYLKDTWQSWAHEQPEFSIEPVPDDVPVTVLPGATEPGSYRAARFTRALDRDWGSRSYSSLTRAAHHAAAPTHYTDDEPDSEPGSEPQSGSSSGFGSGETAPRSQAQSQSHETEPQSQAQTQSHETAQDHEIAPDQETKQEAGTAPDSSPSDAPFSAWNDLPGGTAFGTMVHAVLENSPGDDPETLHRNCKDALARYRVPDVTADRLSGAVGPSLMTPLGSLVAGRCLSDFGRTDSLAELEFEIALDTNSNARSSATLADLADLMAEEIPADDPLGDYPEMLRAISDTTRLRGFLNGSIDAVLRHDTANGPRYFVVDYKTNWLGPRRDSGDPLTTWHYRPEAMAEAMMASHYPLQALLYSVALHRHLRWRLGSDYRPDHDLGGVMYLFLRGMVGPDTPAGSGVFSWQPSADLIARASDLLSGVSR